MARIPHEGAHWDDSTNPDTIVPAGYSTGLSVRDYSLYPQGCFGAAPAFPESDLIPDDQIADIWNEKTKNKSTLLDIREDYFATLQSLDQNGKGLCWAFSTTKQAMYLRKIMNLPDLRLSGWYTAGIVKGWRDQGGWGTESVEQGAANGFCTLDECPSYSSQYATPENARIAATRRITSYWDGSENATLNQKIVITNLLRDRPCVVDLNVMSHSMCCVWFTLNPITFIYDNSWGNNGDRGLYKGTGRYALPDGLVIPRQLRAA